MGSQTEQGDGYVWPPLPGLGLIASNVITKQRRDGLQGPVRTGAEAVRVEGMQGIAQLCGRHDLARCGLLLLP